MEVKSILTLCARVSRLVKLNWYGIYTMAEMASASAFAYPQLRSLWYVWLLNTGMGPMILQHDRGGLARTLWAEWSPSWNPAEREVALERVQASFAGEDWMRVALAAYRSDISSDAERDPDHRALRARLRKPAPLRVPVVLLTGEDDGVEKSFLGREAMERYFPRGVVSSRLRGVGHFPQREAPEAVARAILA